MSKRGNRHNEKKPKAITKRKRLTLGSVAISILGIVSIISLIFFSPSDGTQPFSVGRYDSSIQIVNLGKQ